MGLLLRPCLRPLLLRAADQLLDFVSLTISLRYRHRTKPGALSLALSFFDLRAARARALVVQCLVGRGDQRPAAPAERANLLLQLL